MVVLLLREFFLRTLSVECRLDAIVPHKVGKEGEVAIG